MWKLVNGRRVDLTDDEIKEHKRSQRKARKQEKSEPLTTDGVVDIFIRLAINEYEVDDNTALRMKSYYPTFDSIVGKTVKKGFKFIHNDRLWQVIQPELTIQGHYPPGRGTESLYTEICESYDGSEYDPIPYDNNMALENGKYYTQDNVLYRCFRDTINPVYNPLSELVDLYVTIEDDLNDDEDDRDHGGHGGNGSHSSGRPGGRN